MNIDAENMIDRFVWRRIVPCIILLAFAVVALVYFLH
jgi:hypothetical protein